MEGEQVRSRAATVENAIYKVMTALVAPPESQLPPEAVAPYRPFDIINQIQVPGDTLGITCRWRFSMTLTSFTRYSSGLWNGFWFDGSLELLGG
jgi:hypothetical protein